jgi:diguanylate cyclase (GGDEF)-like protein
MPLTAPHHSQTGLARVALDTLMPMHLVLDGAGRIRAGGPTISRIVDLPDGASFFDVFDVRRPAGIADIAALRSRAGERLFLRAGRTDGGFRGVAVAAANGGAVVNLSFGPGIIEAVRRYGMTEADFAATDLAIELLYVVEAKSLIMEELRRLNLRLQGAKSEAEELAQTDPLTGLRNRRAFDQALKEALDSQDVQPFGLMHIDLDFFKAVNDTHGHAAGDEVLRHVASVLVQETRTSDTVSRVGGDEFMILLPGAPDLPGLSEIAERIIARLGQPVIHDGQPCRVAASAGLWSSLGATPGLGGDEILARLDAALYAAKRKGRGRACFAGEAIGDAGLSGAQEAPPMPRN